MKSHVIICASKFGSCIFHRYENLRIIRRDALVSSRLATLLQFLGKYLR